MEICVEFYGIARRWAGVQSVRLQMPGERTTLGDLFHRLADFIADFGDESICRDGSLHPTLSANLDGSRFVSDPATPIRDGQCVLILSADAGG